MARVAGWQIGSMDNAATHGSLTSAGGSGSGGPVVVAPRGLKRTRGESEHGESSDDEEMRDQGSGTSSPRELSRSPRTPARRMATREEGGSGTAGGVAAAHYPRGTHASKRRMRGYSASTTLSSNDVAGQLERILATVERPGLLAILNALLTQQPDLTARVVELIPLPTLSTAQTVLNGLGSKLREALPLGYGQVEEPFSANATGRKLVRDEYAYGRVRHVLNDIVETSLMYLDHFAAPDPENQRLPPDPFRPTVGGNGGSARTTGAYIGTVYAFLHLLTHFLSTLPAFAILARETSSDALLAPAPLLPVMHKLVVTYLSATLELSRLIHTEFRLFGDRDLREWYRAVEEDDVRLSGRLARAGVMALWQEKVAQGQIRTLPFVGRTGVLGSVAEPGPVIEPTSSRLQRITIS